LLRRPFRYRKAPFKEIWFMARTHRYYIHEHIYHLTHKHLNLWDIKRKPQPLANVYPPLEGPAQRCFPRI